MHARKAMERPTVLLALAEQHPAYAKAAEHAGFSVLTDLEEATSRLAAGGWLDAAVLDADLPMEDASELYASLHREHPVPTVVLVSEDVPRWALSGSPGDARDEYALKPLSADALVYRLQAMMIRSGYTSHPEAHAGQGTGPDGSGSIGEAQVVSVFAPKGGVGKTTVAVNVAVAVREHTRQPVLLLDADVGVGNVTAAIDVPYTMGLADLADSSPAEWTEAAFEQAVSTHELSGVRVLTWGNEPAESDRVSVDLLIAALRWGRRHHSYVIIDTHPGYDDRTMAMLTVANEIFVVVTPEVGPLRNTAQFLDLAREVGLGDTTRIILNRANHGIAHEDIAQALGKPISATIVSNGPRAVEAANEGTPVISKFPRERISSDLHGVARLLTGTPAASVPVQKPWWASLMPRPAAQG
jgi:pilus assembly protein CpaE